MHVLSRPLSGSFASRAVAARVFRNCCSWRGWMRMCRSIMRAYTLPKGAGRPGDPIDAIFLTKIGHFEIVDPTARPGHSCSKPFLISCLALRHQRMKRGVSGTVDLREWMVRDSAGHPFSCLTPLRMITRSTPALFMRARVPIPLDRSTRGSALPEQHLCLSLL